MADELTLTSTLNKAFVPVTSTQQLVYALIDVKPNEVISQSRMSLNFGFVLDHSGSMRGAKIDRLKDAVALALSKMAPDDFVSVTIFSDSAEVIAGSGPLADKRGNLNNKVQRIRAGGGTQMSRGLSLGLREVYRQFAAERGYSPMDRPTATRRSASSSPRRRANTTSPSRRWAWATTGTRSCSTRWGSSAAATRTSSSHPTRSCPSFPRRWSARKSRWCATRR